MSYPCLKINLKGIEKNCRLINGRCTSSGISVVGVSKCLLGDTRITEIFKKCGIDILGDSRLENLQKLRFHFGISQELILLRTPMISEAGNVVSVCQTSTNTQIETVMALSEAALRAGRVHGIIIMVETDDRREGILPGQVLPFCRQVLENCPGVVISGLGTNARCISEKHPEPGSIKMLLDLKEEIERELPVKIGIISGGNSSSLGLVFNNLMPEGVNQIRIGEAILLGHETAEYKPIEGACTDAFVLEAEVIEVKKNNESVSGIIAALGIQDCGYQNIECMDPGLKTINQSSDHTVIAAADNVISEDESALNKFKTGDIITFKLNYFGILASMTSPFVKKQYLV